MNEPIETPSDRRRAASPRRAGGRRYLDDPDLAAAMERAQLRLSALVGELRERQHWSLDQLEYVSGVNAQTVLDIEKMRTNPQLSTLVRLAFVFGFELEIGVRRPRRGGP